MSSSSSSSSGEDWILSTQYRFSGYQLPKIQLDETGPSYVVLPPHPYFTNQPAYWSKPAFRGCMPLKSETIGSGIGGQVGSNNDQIYSENVGQNLGSASPQMLPF